MGFDSQRLEITLRGSGDTHHLTMKSAQSNWIESISR